MGQQWRDEEDAILYEEYPQGRVWVAAAHRRLPGRSVSAVVQRAAVLGLTKQAPLPWRPSFQKGRLPRGFAARAHQQRRQRRNHG